MFREFRGPCSSVLFHGVILVNGCHVKTEVGHARGLTLVELLAALALTSLLMAGLTGVLRCLQTHRATLESERRFEPWQEQFLDTLCWDLENSRRMLVKGAECRLEGFAGRDFLSHVATHELARIVYHPVKIGRHDWLVRREVHPADRTNRNARSELVCCGAVRLEVTNGLEEPAPLPSSSIDARNTDESPPASSAPIPRRARIVLRDKEGTVLLDRVLMLSCCE